MKLFSGNANLDLANRIACNLNIKLGKAKVGKFSDGEIMVEILENVRGHEVFVLQPTCAPTNDNLMELIIMVDALRRASAASITAVVPYFGYARQDRRIRSARVPISARVIADLMEVAGVSRLITVDLHAEQIQGFFGIPVDNVYGTTIIYKDIEHKHLASPIVVSPDIGGVARARAVAKRLGGISFAVIDKRRETYNQVTEMNIIGDVKGKDCLLVDDIIDTAGTICLAAKKLADEGANTVTVYATHPILSGNAISNLENSPIQEVVVTDTVVLSESARNCSKIRQLTISNLLADTIRCVDQKLSVSALFNN